MAFNKKFKELEDVLLEYNIPYKQEDLGISKKDSPSQYFKDELNYTIQKIPYRSSEAAVCENIIYPILRESLKKYDEILSIWVRKPIKFDNELSGIPDYTISQRSKRGKIFFEHPLLAVIEAKKDDFTGGWGQCCIEMYTIRKINNIEDLEVFGIVTNGDVWEFGKLTKDTFVQFNPNLALTDIDMLFSALATIFENCKAQLTKLN
jgi:hypothetical protein